MIQRSCPTPLLATISGECNMVVRASSNSVSAAEMNIDFQHQTAAITEAVIITESLNKEVTHSLLNSCSDMKHSILSSTWIPSTPHANAAIIILRCVTVRPWCSSLNSMTWRPMRTLKESTLLSTSLSLISCSSSISLSFSEEFASLLTS